MRNIRNTFLVSALSLGLIVGAVGVVSAATSSNIKAASVSAPAVSLLAAPKISTVVTTTQDINAAQNSGSQNQTPPNSAQQIAPQPSVPSQPTPQPAGPNQSAPRYGNGYGYGCGNYRNGYGCGYYGNGYNGNGSW